MGWSFTQATSGSAGWLGEGDSLAALCSVERSVPGSEDLEARAKVDGLGLLQQADDLLQNLLLFGFVLVSIWLLRWIFGRHRR